MLILYIQYTTYIKDECANHILMSGGLKSKRIYLCQYVTRTVSTVDISTPNGNVSSLVV